MATNEKIKIIKGSEVLPITDPTGATFLGYKTVNGEKQTIQVDFSNMTPLFGVSQTVGTSTTLAPSEKAVGDAIEIVNNQVNNNTNQLNEYEMAIKDMTPPHMRFKTKIRMVFNNDTESIQYGYGALRFNTSPTIVDERLLLVEVNKETSKLIMPSQANVAVRHAVVLPVGEINYNIYTSDIKSILCSSELTKMQYMEVSSNDVNNDTLNLNAAYGTININKFTSLKYLAWGVQITQKTVDCSDSKELLEFNGAKNKHFVSFYFDGVKIQKINLQGCSSFSNMLAVSSALSLKEVDLSGTAAIIETLKRLNAIWYTGNNGTLTINAALHTELINEAPDLYTAFINKGITIVSVA